MALNATTLSAAVNIYNTSFGVVSATGVLTPTYSSGNASAGLITYALCEGELMTVTGVTGTFITVLRGQFGTQGASHASGTPILFGLASDFPNFTPAVSAFSVGTGRFNDFSAPIASAATIVANGSRFHVTGTVAIVNITLATGFVGGTITIIFDGVDTWTAAGNIAVAGTNTTALSAVTFYYDPNTSKWYPDRVA